MSSGTIYNESKLFECQAVQFTKAVQFTMKINFWMSSGTIYNESKLSECQAVQFTMKLNFLNVKRYNLQWK
jgi:hypothetical protein